MIPNLTKEVPMGEGKCTVVWLELPAELKAWTWITGDIALIRNDGYEDWIALIFITEWDGRMYIASVYSQPGWEFYIVLLKGMYLMPNQDAHVTFYACHEEPGGELYDEAYDRHYRIESIADRWIRVIPSDCPGG